MSSLGNVLSPTPIHALEPRLGVDIGRVIIAGDGADSSFIGGSDEEAMRAPEVNGAIDALTALCTHFEGRVWLVSKCGKRIQSRTREWLARHDLFARTGIDPANLVFCLKRPEKAPICAKLGIDFFVDDRADVLTSMFEIVPHLFLFGAATAPDARITPVPDWAFAERSIVAATWVST